MSDNHYNQNRFSIIMIIFVFENKLSLDTEQDIDVILKALGDYYKKGEISGKPYGTFAGKELQTQNANNIK